MLDSAPLPTALDLDVARVAVTADARWASPVGRALRALGVPAAAAGEVTSATLCVRAVGALPPAPPEAHLVATYDPRARLFADPDAPGTVRARSPGGDGHVTGAEAEVALAPGAAAAEVAWHVALALQLVARSAGAFPLHAAALVAPGGEGVLVVGPSDVGKSTLAYTLVRAGWGFLTDDSVLLAPTADGGPPEAVAFRRRFGLDADGLAPAMAAHAEPQPAEAGKWSLDVDALHPGQAHGRCRPQLLVFPELTGADASYARPLAPAEAYVRLLAPSGQRVLRDAQTAAHHDALGRLAGGTRAVGLAAGRDLLGPPAVAAALLARELAAA